MFPQPSQMRPPGGRMVDGPLDIQVSREYLNKRQQIKTGAPTAWGIGLFRQRLGEKTKRKAKGETPVVASFPCQTITFTNSWICYEKTEAEEPNNNWG